MSILSSFWEIYFFAIRVCFLLDFRFTSAVMRMQRHEKHITCSNTYHFAELFDVSVILIANNHSLCFVNIVTYCRILHCSHALAFSIPWLCSFCTISASNTVSSAYRTLFIILPLVFCSANSPSFVKGEKVMVQGTSLPNAFLESFVMRIYFHFQLLIFVPIQITNNPDIFSI